MRVINNERVICFDVDKTLVMPLVNADLARQTVEINDPYSGTTTLRLPHYPHIKMLKNYVARGAQVVVWSKNGNQWAAEVLKALKLDHLDVIVFTKPTAYVDDELSIKWMGEHVYIDPADSFGSGETV
jgi:predicted phosphatase